MTKAVLFLALIVVGWSGMNLIRQSRRAPITATPRSDVTPTKVSALINKTGEPKHVRVDANLTMMPFTLGPDYYIVIRLPSGRSLVVDLTPEDGGREFAEAK